METGETVTARGPAAEPARSLGPAPPGVVLGSLTVPSLHEPWFVSLKKQLGELLSKQPPPPKHQGAPIRWTDKEARLAVLNLRVLHEPWFVSLQRQIKALRAEKKLPPLKILFEAGSREEHLGSLRLQTARGRRLRGSACRRGRARIFRLRGRWRDDTSRKLDRPGDGFRHRPIHGGSAQGAGGWKERRRRRRRAKLSLAAQQGQIASVFDEANCAAHSGDQEPRPETFG